MALNFSLMLLMCLSTLQQACSSTIPPGTPPRMPTTMPLERTTLPDCITDSGRRLMVGEFWEKDCKFCWCDRYYGYYCYQTHCQPPMCVDPEPVYVGCECYTCLNGDNCKIPETGEVIPSGEPVIRNGMECRCPPKSYKMPAKWEEENYIANCVSVSTLPQTPPPTTPSTIPPTTTQKRIKKSRKNKQSKKDRKIARRTKTP